MLSGQMIILLLSCYTLPPMQHRTEEKFCLGNEKVFYCTFNDVSLPSACHFDPPAVQKPPQLSKFQALHILYQALQSFLSLRCY